MRTTPKVFDTGVQAPTEKKDLKLETKQPVTKKAPVVVEPKAFEASAAAVRSVNPGQRADVPSTVRGNLGWDVKAPIARTWSVEQPPRTISREENRARLATEEASLGAYLQGAVGQKLSLVDNDPGFANADGSYGRVRNFAGTLVGTGVDENQNRWVELRGNDGATRRETLSVARQVKAELLD